MSPARYSTGAIVLHCVIALALAFQISLGWALEGPPGPDLINRYFVHKSLGITILALSLIRLGIRLTVPRPAPTEPGWTAKLAETVHWLFYVAMIGAPLSGWAISSTAGREYAADVWGLFNLPNLPLGEAAHDPAEGMHSALVLLALVLLLLHIAGALRHQWLLGKPELQRMIPWARGKAVLSAIVAIGLIVGAMAAAKFVSPPPPGAEYEHD